MSLNSLQDLVLNAAELADEQAYFIAGRRWEMTGGRQCPVAEPGCSQPVFIDKVNGEYDYGGRGGPGYHFCRSQCERGHRNQF